MQLPPRRDASPTSRADDGAAMVEFAFVGLILAVFLFGIINMGVLLSFKQNMTQAASESARAAIPVVNDTTTPQDERYIVVDDTLNRTVGEFDQACNVDGLTCERKVHDCAANTDDYAAIVENLNADPACVTVRIEFDNTGGNRIMPAFPLIASFEPKTMSSQTTSRLVPVPQLTP